MPKGHKASGAKGKGMAHLLLKALASQQPAGNFVLRIFHGEFNKRAKRLSISFSPSPETLRSRGFVYMQLEGRRRPTFKTSPLSSCGHGDAINGLQTNMKEAATSWGGSYFIAPHQRLSLCAWRSRPNRRI
jgi:hypothetical protein